MIASIFFLALVAQLAKSGIQAVPQNAAFVEVILYSDFQCPFCRQFSEPFRELQTKGIEGIETKVQFKNFPLSIHSNAQLAHQAAMAAREQGKFWEMHDLLFANQSAVKREDLMAYAKKLGLNLARFTKDMDSDRIKDLIKADVSEGEGLQVNATPTFFVNSKPYTGVRSFDQLRELVLVEKRRAIALTELPDNLTSKGPADASITLEFFADLQSPLTGPALKVIEQVVSRYPSAVRVQFRNFPLGFHPQAALAHEAAMAAARDGRFWEFAAYCLDHQDSLAEEDLVAHAGRLGLDEGDFVATLQKHNFATRVQTDVEVGFERGIRGSPTVLVNGRKVDGVPSLETLTKYVEAELASHEIRKP
jgi:protein-disulfide isomerase